MKPTKLTKIPLPVSIRIRYLFQDKGVRGKELIKMFPKYSRRSIYRHASKPIDAVADDKRKQNPGRPRKLSTRDTRAIIREIPRLRESVGSFTTKRLKVATGIGDRVCDETVRRALKDADYGYYHSRKKGLLKANDLRERLKFSKKVKKLMDEKTFWTEGIAFYFDGASFQHKYNPSDEARSTRTMAWRKKSEGLDLHCTAKGSHVGSGGRVAHFLVAIAHNRGVILCEQYYGNINGEMFAQFISDHFNEAFEKSANPRGKLFLQDGDPSQNSKKAKVALDAVGARLFSIPPRSPDMNPIENIFNIAKQNLRADALSKNIVRETFDEFSKRIKETLIAIPLQTINKTIESMAGRMTMVVKAKGKRIRY